MPMPFFINLPNNSIHPMQRIQNQVAKLIMNRDRCESSTSTIIQLHWLPIGFRSKYKVLLLVYRCMNGQAPEYLQQKLFIEKSSTDNTTQPLKEIYSRFPTTKGGPWQTMASLLQGQNFGTAYLLSCKLCQLFSIFKKLLKTHLFKICYNL